MSGGVSTPPTAEAEMLGFSQVRARREGDRLLLKELKPKQRLRAVEIAEQYLSLTAGAVGLAREEIERELDTVELRPSERRLGLGMRKLIEDASEYARGGAHDPAALRGQLFFDAARARRAGTVDQPFDRERVLGLSAARLGLSSAELEASLYADLRGAERLVRGPELEPEALVVAYERAQVQALLLRAVEVTADVRCRSPDAYRDLFRKLKFRQLLYRLEPRPDGGYRIVIDGPFSLFEPVTKYGLELSMMLPVLETCDNLELTARVLWGSRREPLVFQHRRVGTDSTALEPSPPREEVEELLSAFSAPGGEWRARISNQILDLPGVGVCVPDLVFSHRSGGDPVYLELLGLWSRDAVWRRVELVEQGLTQRIVFAVSARLRVSEHALGDRSSAALYVFRGQPNPRALERKLEALRARG